MLETHLILGAGLVASTAHRKWSINKTEEPIAFLYLMCVPGLRRGQFDISVQGRYSQL